MCTITSLSHHTSSRAWHMQIIVTVIIWKVLLQIKLETCTAVCLRSLRCSHTSHTLFTDCFLFITTSCCSLSQQKSDQSLSQHRQCWPFHCNACKFGTAGHHGIACHNNSNTIATPCLRCRSGGCMHVQACILSALQVDTPLAVSASCMSMPTPSALRHVLSYSGSQLLQNITLVSLLLQCLPLP